MKAWLSATILLATIAGWDSAYAQEIGDPGQGESVFKKCMPCHKVGPDARNGVGRC